MKSFSAFGLICVLACGAPLEPSAGESVEEPVCAGGLAVPWPPPGALLTEIDPADTNPAIDQVPERRHLLMVDPTVDSREELYVILPGSGSDSHRGMNLLRIAAHAGYRAIGLGYVNQPSINSRCRGQPVSCHGEVLEENVYGRDTSDRLDVDPANSVLGRLGALVHYLDDQHPDAGWDGFIGPRGGLRMSKIAFAGGSQGGKTVAYISKDFDVARVNMLSGTGSAARGPGGEIVLADWTLEPRTTSPEKVFALWHEQEAADAYAPVILDQYGVPGPIFDVDDASPPYEGSHQLRTNLLPASSDYADAHGSTGADDLQAKGEHGEPLLWPAYLYMMTAPVSL